MQNIKILFTLLLLGTAMSVSGCVFAPGGGGGHHWHHWHHWNG